jgi:hypothetical protein
MIRPSSALLAAGILLCSVVPSGLATESTLLTAEGIEQDLFGAKPGDAFDLSTLDTVVYNTTYYYYNPSRRRGDTTVVWFSPPTGCALVGMLLDFYAPGEAEMFAWHAPEFVAGDLSKFAYDSGIGLGSVADSTDLIAGPVPISSPGTGWARVDFPEPIDLGSRDFFLGFVYTQNDYPQTYMDFRGSFLPARSYQYRTAYSEWREYDVHSSGDFLLQAIVSYYAPPPVGVHLNCARPLVPRGGTLSYLYAFMNNTPQPQSLLYWTKVQLPNGTWLNAVPPRSFQLAPRDTSTYSMSHRVPLQAPLGLYEYWGYVGPDTATIWDWEAFSFRVRGTAGGKD